MSASTPKPPGPGQEPNPDNPAEPLAPGQLPPAGPHARPDLTDETKTPGAGTLPDDDPSVDGATG
jgi:hypothetical protein